MVGLMKYNRKNPVGTRHTANPKLSDSLCANPDIAQQYEDLCCLRRKVRKLSEKA
jgi:hypothetical protein